MKNLLHYLQLNIKQLDSKEMINYLVLINSNIINKDYLF